MTPPRIGRLAFGFGSTLAFMPALASGASDAMAAFGAAAGTLTLLPDDAGNLPAIDLDALSAGAGPSFATLALGVLGWAAFGLLAAGRSRDLGDPPALGLLALPAAAASLPSAPGWASATAWVGVLAWSLRLGFAAGVPPRRTRSPSGKAAMRR